MGHHWRAVSDRLSGRHRVERLRRAGRTVEMSALLPKTRVIEINIGFGRELWAVPAGELRFAPEAIADGQLLVSGHRRATATGFLRAAGRRPEHIPTRI